MPSTIGPLSEEWQAEHTQWARRDLASVDYVYWWVDGIHFNVRVVADWSRCLVVVGVRPDGTNELVALQDGDREDTDSWVDLRASRRAQRRPGEGLH